MLFKLNQFSLNNLCLIVVPYKWNGSKLNNYELFWQRGLTQQRLKGKRIIGSIKTKRNRKIFVKNSNSKPHNTLGCRRFYFKYVYHGNFF